MKSQIHLWVLSVTGVLLGACSMGGNVSVPSQPDDGHIAMAALSSCAPVNLDLGAFYRLLAKHSGKALEVSGVQQQNGARVIQYRYLGQANQQWKFTPVAGGFVKLTARHSGKVLDVAAASLSNGAAIQQWDDVNGANQQWCVQPSGGGYYRLLAKHSGKAVDVSDLSQADGAPVHQWDDVGGDNQQWKIEPVDAPLPPPAVPALKLGTLLSLQTVTPGAEGRSLGQAGGLGVTEAVDAASPEALKQATSWKVVAGLADPACYSFQALGPSEQYLRHQERRLRSAPNDNSALFRQDATFCARPALNGVAGRLSLEAKSFAGSFVRHRNTEVWLDPNDNSTLFGQDATWAPGAAWSDAVVTTPPPPPPSPTPTPTPAPGPLPGPAPVGKAAGPKVYVHMMPWFESKASSGTGKWGQHWTMANQNPDLVDGSGKRQIASHYSPLTGPYASSDPNIIEYQLLLMKLSGIDGVLIDWPGTTKLYDYPANLANAEAIIARLGKVGLGFAVVYEDQNVGIAAGRGVVTDKIGQGKADLAYMQSNYFGRGNYIRVNGRPLLAVFGPQTFGAAGDWQQIFAGLSTKPCFATLWDKYASTGGTDCTGEFGWVYQDAGRPHLKVLNDFYQNHPDHGVKIGSAYPGFHDFYAQGGWGGGYFYIPENGTDTLSQTLDLALKSGVKFVQLVTWNDYGEGTIVEPTREFGYSRLTTVQRKLGVPYGQAELELVGQLYNQRLQYAGDARQQIRLDGAAAYLAALQLDQARAALAATP